MKPGPAGYESRQAMRSGAPDPLTAPSESVLEELMPQQGWSKKRERQYDAIKEGLKDKGRPEDTAQEIASGTVNKEGARAGEPRTATRRPADDISSSRRGGLRSHKGSGGRTKAQLYAEAKKRNIAGR